MKLCECYYTPIGDCGMEGFVLNEKYWFDIIKNENNKKTFIVFLTDDGYKYEMKKARFNKYFHRVPYIKDSES